MHLETAGEAALVIWERRMCCWLLKMCVAGAKEGVFPKGAVEIMEDEGELALQQLQAN